ncbi:MAG TPA: tetratricopeptide repeat protein, partial [Thermoanaerobaculia bacterium]|nr:tetratricopeptide repeat protein [Thermoanaerobaculia bacterium]
SDPTQMVAYRLLVDAYLQQGKAEEARQRLRIYGLLNDADPEIAELRRRIGELDRGRGEETAGTSERRARGPEPRSESGSGPGREEPPLAAPPAAGEPFPALASSEARRSYLHALAAEGLFEIDLEAGWKAGSATELEPTGPRAAERQPAWGEVFDLSAPGGAPEPDLASLLDSSQSDGEPSPDRAPDRPTVTLGRLYLRQGHLREAEEIFRGVLAVEPGNAEARRHLGELEAAPASAEPQPAGSAREPGPALGAAELLAGLAGGEGVTERKRYVLERYLERVRGRAPRDVH